MSKIVIILCAVIAVVSASNDNTNVRTYVYNTRVHITNDFDNYKAEVQRFYETIVKVTDSLMTDFSNLLIQTTDNISNLYGNNSNENPQILHCVEKASELTDLTNKARMRITMNIDLGIGEIFTVIEGYSSSCTDAISTLKNYEEQLYNQNFDYQSLKNIVDDTSRLRMKLLLKSQPVFNTLTKKIEKYSSTEYGQKTYIELSNKMLTVINDIGSCLKSV